MSHLAHIIPASATQRYFGPAEVTHNGLADGLAHVSFTARGETHAAWARVAVPAAGTLHPGDEVLVAGESAAQLFIIGILTSPQVNTESEIRTAGGAHARIAGHASSQRLQVYSERDELLFEYDPGAQKARVTIAAGDLDFETGAGDIRFKSARDILFEGRDIDLAAHSAIRLDVVDALRKSTASLSMGLRRLKAAAAQMTFDAGRAQLSVEETRYVGKRLLSRIAYTQLVADKCETVTRVLVEKSKNAYRSVEQLSQLKAGRIRALVTDTYQMSAGKAFLATRQDFKVKADKIHLG